jgi:hypothetical protein
MSEALRVLPPVEEVRDSKDSWVDLDVYTPLGAVGVDAGILRAAADLEARNKLKSAILLAADKSRGLEIGDQRREISQKINGQYLQRPVLEVDVFVTPQLPQVTQNGKFMGYAAGRRVSQELIQQAKLDGVSLGDLSMEMFDFDFTPKVPGVAQSANLDGFKSNGLNGTSPLEAAHYGRLASCTFYLAPHIPDFAELLGKLNKFCQKYSLKVTEVEWLMANLYHDLSAKYLHKITGVASRINVDDLDNFVNNHQLLDHAADTRNTDMVIALLYAQKALLDFADEAEMQNNFENMDIFYQEFLFDQFA